MSGDKKGDLKIIGWSIDVKWSNGKEEKITEIPDEVAQYIDDYLTEIEGEAMEEQKWLAENVWDGKE